MRFAYWILTNDKEEKFFWQNRYKYICVDEAQDASKIQHKIIQIIAHGNNIFMVGDEDQSIYGFRAAYPKALLNFRTDYINPYILLMERNYRSTPQIVEKAQNFISENKGRYEKKIVADRSDGESVELIKVSSIEAQYMKILSIARDAKKETAFLYRNNENSVVLVDLFLRNGIKFRLKKPEFNFFGNSVVRDITAYLSLSINPYDTDSFKQICNKGILYLKKEHQEHVVQKCKYKKTTVLDAAEHQMQYLPYNDRDRADRLKNAIYDIDGKKTEDAIRSILQHGYKRYLKEKHEDYSKIEILFVLAKQEPNISKYLNRLKELELSIKKGFNDDDLITISTIHSSKGLEYDTVYLLDVYDGRFPSSQRNPFSRSKDSASGEQEERRLFYVGITRAKNKLALFDIANRQSSYIESLFPEKREAKIGVEFKEMTNWHEEIERICQFDIQSIIASRDSREIEEIRRFNLQNQRIAEERRKKEEEERKKAAEKLYQDCYNEVKDRFTQQNTPIRDSCGIRWIKCEICGQIFQESEFTSYGGMGHVNLGVCKSCRKNR